MRKRKTVQQTVIRFAASERKTKCDCSATRFSFIVRREDSWFVHAVRGSDRVSGVGRPTLVMDNLEIFKDEIANAIQSEPYILAQVVAYLTERHDYMKGFSERTLRRYCNENGIRASSKAYVADDVLA